MARLERAATSFWSATRSPGPRMQTRPRSDISWPIRPRGRAEIRAGPSNWRTSPTTSCLCATLVGAGGTAWSDSFTGHASIIDGDTLEIHGTRVRLWGVDRPESSQLCRGDDSLPYRCGAKATNDLDAFIASRPVNCLPISLDVTAAPWRRAPLVVPTWAIGLCADSLPDAANARGSDACPEWD
jgi:endonuclease YncB( thermonuclease family)